MSMTQVRVRRERPTALAWAIALAVTMLVVYVLTLDATMPDAVESVSAAPRVTREIEFEALKVYCVSMGQWPDAAQARVEAAGYAAQGAAGFVYPLDGAWHVLGALYDTERAAKRVASRLRADGAAEAEVICLEAESVKLRITAPERQIDAIAAADACLRGQVAQLDDMALQLDRGDMRKDAARTLCAVGGTEAADAAEKLDGIPGAGENALCAGLIEACQALAEQLEVIAGSGQDSEAALSGMVRLAEVDAFLRLREIQNGLVKG